MRYCLTLFAVAAAVAAAPLAAQTESSVPRAAITRGAATAPVTVYEMSDFQCPWCARFAIETMPALEREYVATGKVKFIFVNLPIPTHENAVPAAELAMCAARQQRFWQVHDLLFRHQERWSRLREPGTFFLGLADSAGADRDTMAACLRTGTTRSYVEADARSAVRSGARSTPSFYIEGGMLSGAHPIEVWRQLLDSIVAEKTGGRAVRRDRTPER